MTRTRRTTLWTDPLEPLEARDVPAGNVTASLSPTGVLTLIGDDFGNGIERLTVTPGSVTIDPDATTAVNGGAAGAPVTFTGHTAAITAVLEGGPDELRIDPSVDFIVPGVVSFDLGEGDNTLDLAVDQATQQLLRIGTLVVRARDGFDTLVIRGGIRGTIDHPPPLQLSYVRAMTVNLGHGGSDTTLGVAQIGAFPAPVMITGGDGRDEVHFEVVTFESALAIAGGPGVLRVSGNASGGALTITGEDVDYETEGGSFGGVQFGVIPINIVGGHTATATLRDGGFFGPLTVQALRADSVATVDVNGSVGMNPLPPLAAVSVRSGGSASFNVRPGADFNINGRIGVTAGLGDALVQVDSGKLVVHGSLSVASLGGDARLVESGALDATQFVVDTFDDFGTRGPDAKFAISAARTAEFVLAGGQAEIAAPVSITGRTAARLIQSGPDTIGLVHGSVLVAGGATESRFDVTGDKWTTEGTTVVRSPGRAVLNVGAATPSRFMANVSVRGGSGFDDVTANATAEFRRNLAVTLGSGGGQVSFQPGAFVAGTLTVRGGSGADVISLRGTGAEDTRIVTGGGKDTLEVELGSFPNQFFADLGAGDDTISIAQSLGSPSPVGLYGPTTILAGLGDDTLLLGRSVAAGGDANSRVRFQAPANRIDGGAGVNFFDDESAQIELMGTATLTTPNWTDPTP